MALVTLLIIGLFIAMPLMSLLAISSGSEGFPWMMSVLVMIFVIFIVTSLVVILIARRASAGTGGNGGGDRPSVEQTIGRGSYDFDVHAGENKASVIGRCPKCGNLVFIGDRQCFKCGWKVNARRLRPIED